MLPILYTTTDSLRSILGVTDEDLSDEQITSRNVEKELVMDLAVWCSNHEKLMDSPNENLVNAIELYSAYFCARLVISSLQLGAFQRVTDGKNASDRFSNMDFDKLYDRMSERVAYYKKFVLDTISTVTSSTVFKPFSAVGLSVDPVTG